MKLTIALLLLCLSSSAQPFTTFGVGMTNNNFSAELQAGIQIKKVILSASYIAAPESTLPVLFNTRLGYLYNERLLVYGGLVWLTYSSDDKKRNSKTYQLGAQYLFCFYDRGSFFAGANYTKGFVTGNLGMTFNLVK